jgi:hypothetical protein
VSVLTQREAGRDQPGRSRKRDINSASTVKPTPPVGLVAPTLCPRCDTPAAAANGERAAEQCAQCSLQLRWCGNCRGVAGPFDRFCGFCGFELIRGDRPGAVRRLWVLVALVPLVAGLGYGLWAARAPAAVAGVMRAAPRTTPAQPSNVTEYGSQGLGLRYSAPRDWTVVDYTGGAGARALVVVTRAQADQAAAAGVAGDLSALDHVQSALVALGRPAQGGGLVADPRDPLAALTAEVAPLVAAPPAGTAVEVARPIHAVSIGGRPAAEVVLKLTRGDDVAYLRRDLVYAPHGSAAPQVQVDALVPAAEWPSAGTDTVTRSLRFR